MPVFICNILQGAWITKLIQVCQVVSQTLREGTNVFLVCEGDLEELVQLGGM